MLQFNQSTLQPLRYGIYIYIYVHTYTYILPAFDQLCQQEPHQNHCEWPPGLLPLLQEQDLSRIPSQI